MSLYTYIRTEKSCPVIVFGEMKYAICIFQEYCSILGAFTLVINQIIETYFESTYDVTNTKKDLVGYSKNSSLL